MKRMVCALALATGTGVVLGPGVQLASADPASATTSTGLQLTIVPPAAPTSDAPATLDINFRGGTIRSVELFVDNTKVFKKSVKFNATHGNFNLKVDSALLPEGDHEVMVVAVDADGSTATSTVKIHVSGPEIEGIAQFAYPRRNAMVQNVVPIELKLDPNIKAPYVAFLLDNDFLSIRNYAPYIYNWDSSKISDGPHTIGVEVYDSASQQLLKKMSIPVVVKNVGGFTTIQPITPTISASTREVPMHKAIAGVLSEPAPRTPEENSALNRSHGQPVSNYALRSAEPLSSTLFNHSETQPTSVVPVLDPKNPVPESLSSVGVKATPRSPVALAARSFEPSLPAMIAEPSAAPLTSLDEGRIERLQIRPMRAGNIAARPHATLESPRSLKPIMIAQYLTPPVAYIRSHRVHGVKTFDIAFNNSRIAFDVQPRVDRGTPLAPFRAIFEHTGGTVQWFGKSQTIRAISANRQIEFKIGQKTARVNNRIVNLAYTPYVENGRAIVPLSFVRDAMNVKVTYDARNSQLSIESNR